MNKNLIVLLCSILFVSSCASKVTPVKSNSKPITVYEEDISYLLPEFKIEEEETIAVMEPLKEIAFENDNKLIDNMLAKIVEENKSFSSGVGYRIQIFSGNSKSDFESAKSYILRNFPELEVYESYSHPTYRVKAGDFIHLQDAIRYNLDLKNYFGTTRVLNEKINLNKALNIK